MPHADKTGNPALFIPTPKDDAETESTTASVPLSPIVRSLSQSSFESTLSWTPTPFTPVTSFTDTSTRPSEDIASEYVDDDVAITTETVFGMDDATDDEDKTVSVPITFKDTNGVLEEYHLDIRETELFAGQEQGYAYIGIEHEETEEQAIAREDKAKQTGWMDGWLARTNPAKYQAKPKTWVPNGEGGGRWVDVDPDTRLRVILEWKRARYSDTRWLVETEVLEREHTRMEKLDSPPLRFKIEVTRPRAPQLPDPLTGRFLRFQPPLMGSFSAQQDSLLDGKEWPARRLAELGSLRRSQRVTGRATGSADSH
ncbi:hypothetical protein PMIN03_009677 [Paraphaeosphaeria minitans]